MRSLFVLSAREWSGSMRAFTQAACGLAERGHEVAIVVEPESTVEQIVSQTVSTSAGLTSPSAVSSRSASSSSATPSSISLRSISPAWSSVRVESLVLHGLGIIGVFRLRALLKSWRPDTVFVHTTREHVMTSVACWLGGRAQIVRRIPAGQTIKAQWGTRIATWLTPTCFMFTTEEDATASQTPRKTVAKTVVPLGIRLPDLTRFAVSDGEQGSEQEYIVCIHDSSSRSRAATAIRTLAMLVRQHPSLRLIIIGEGAYDDDLRMQAAALRVLNLITFLGERDDALYVMRSAKLGWVVADHDTAAYALLDFMGLEVPVLAGEHSMAERYVLSQITGVLLPSDDAHLTAATVADLLVDEASRLNMGEAARSRIQREYPEGAMIDGFEQVVSQMATIRRR